MGCHLSVGSMGGRYDGAGVVKRLSVRSSLVENV